MYVEKRESEVEENVRKEDCKLVVGDFSVLRGLYFVIREFYFISCIRDVC